MTLSYPMVKAIFDTLPIGYYLGRAIDCELSADGRESYFNSAADQIVISYHMIADAATELEATISGDEVEQIIRGLLYHEISHVILTPKSLRMNTALNIVEDERIESICKNLYMNTNFFDNLVKINHFKGEAPTNADSAFYQLVRFHIGTEYWLTRCRDLLRKYSHLNSASSYVRDYAQEVKDFYEDFINWYNEEASKNNKEENTSSEEKEEDENKEAATGNTKSMEAKASGNMEESNSSESAESKANNTSEGEEKEDTSSKKDTSSESIPGHGTKPNDIDDISIDIDEFRNIIGDSLNTYYDESLLNKLSTIINMAMKKNKRNGSAINSYSGKFNVKAVGREDYRWWVQQNRAGHVKHNSNVHFNLFIDNSGSFCYNDLAMNQFIKALDKIEKSISTFSFDVITINTEVEEWTTHDKIFSSYGGNKLLPSIKEVIKKHQLAKSTNYNIVLFDGDAHSDDDWGWGRAKSSDPFKFFNLPNTIIISDYDNKEYMDAVHMTQAKVKYTNNYCKEFINIICNLLEKTL